MLTLVRSMYASMQVSKGKEIDPSKIITIGSEWRMQIKSVKFVTEHQRSPITSNSFRYGLFGSNIHKKTSKCMRISMLNTSIPIFSTCFFLFQEKKQFLRKRTIDESKSRAEMTLIQLEKPLESICLVLITVICWHIGKDQLLYILDFDKYFCSEAMRVDQFKMLLQFVYLLDLTIVLHL